MQKKFALVFLFILLLILFPSIASAQTATSPSTLKGQMRDLREQTREEIQALRDQFKARLQTIRDTRKRLVVEKLDLKIASSNTKHTARFSELLAKLQTILDRFKASAEPSAASDIVKAQDAINTAKDAVASQSAKIYAIQITTEPNLKINVGTTVSQFRKDLMAVHKLVIDAKQAVQKLNTFRGAIKREATNSANL